MSFLSKEKLSSYTSEPNYGALGAIVDTRTYRRYLPHLGRRESFLEREERVINYTLSLVEDKLPRDFLEAEAELILDKSMELKIWPSSRNKWIGGTQAVKDNPEAIFNCSATIINSLERIPEVLLLLSLGIGVGFRVFRRDVEAIPPILTKPSLVIEDYNSLPKEARDEDTYMRVKNRTVYIEVGDSREGWAEAIRLYFSTLYKDIDSVVINLDSVRPVGERIKGFGGTASGPEALASILREIHRVVLEAGNKFSPLDIMDMICAIAKGMVSGSTRRCLPKGTLVSTTRGLIPIEEVTGLDHVYDSTYTPRRVLNHFDQGVQELWRVDTNCYSFYATPNHRMAVKEGKGYTWKTIRELSKDDVLVHSSLATSGYVTRLPNNRVVTKEIAWLIGYVRNYGYKEKGGMVITTPSSKKVEVRLRKALSLLVPKESVVGSDSLTILDKEVEAMLSEYAHAYSIPPFILQSTETNRLAYLEGLGEVVTTNTNFLRQIAVLYSSLGILAKSSTDLTGVKPLLPKWLRSLGSRFLSVRVKSVVNSGIREQTYDLEVEETHEFFANGLLSHNSALICLFEEGDKEIAECKKDLYTNTTLSHKIYRAQSNNTECIGSSRVEEFIDWLIESNPSTEEVIKWIGVPNRDLLDQRIDSIRVSGEPGFNNYLWLVWKRYVAAKAYGRANIKKYLLNIVTNP